MFEVREKPKLVERALLVGVQRPEDSEASINGLLDELRELVETLGIGVEDRVIARLREPQARLLLGSGKTESIITLARERQCDCIVFDAELTPGQQRNWETLSGLCVIDRQEIILDIFHERAQTKEAVLQVELARAEHSLPRLKNAWTHLSRQRGGGVTQRGEGEAQIELDQRMVRRQIASLRRELEHVVKQRKVQRSQRQRIPLPTGAIVGYTNSGKSTLLNALTGADVVAEDKLFATLDPTTRRMILPGGQKILLTDTVGFVRRLPHRLVDAFKATLEEAVQSDFLIHVVDLTNPDMVEHFETTVAVLKELGAADNPTIHVLNKIDALDLNGADRPRTPDGSLLPISDGLYVSALSGRGLEDLASAIVTLLAKERRTVELLIPHNRYDLMHRLHEAGAVRHEHATDDGIEVVGAIPQSLESAVAPFVVEG